LRQVASKYPVTLYTSANCGACGSGRAYLASRGVPFAEKTISSPEDAEALKRIAGESVVPIVTIGGQRLRGYSDSEWGQYLDAAGYPRQSALPASWRNPEPSPLVAVQRPVAPSATAADAAAPARSNRPASSSEPCAWPACVRTSSS
jgi:glutaredoxin